MLHNAWTDVKQYNIKTKHCRFTLYRDLKFVSVSPNIFFCVSKKGRLPHRGVSQTRYCLFRSRDTFKHSLFNVLFLQPPAVCQLELHEALISTTIALIDRSHHSLPSICSLSLPLSSSRLPISLIFSHSLSSLPDWKVIPVRPCVLFSSGPPQPVAKVEAAGSSFSLPVSMWPLLGQRGGGVFGRWKCHWWRGRGTVLGYPTAFCW